jgi:restriction endonuclease S subunit
MSVVKEGWTYKNFEECLVKAPKAKQVQTSEYNSGTRYPIVSQEDKLVSGYCDDSSLLYHIDNPVVIFGDHTRVLKYVDFDFVVGADGVKILIPKEFLNAKFLFFYLQWYNIPSLGYSRHYKLLKEISIPVPPLPTQQSIVSELDKINELIALKKSQLKDLDTLAQSIFYEMFGDPVINEKGWEVKRLCEISSVISNGNTPKGGNEVYVDNGYLFLRSQNVWKNRIDLDDVAYIDDATHKKLMKSSLMHNDLLITKTGRFNTENSSLGRTALFEGENGSANINGHVYLVRLKPGMVHKFVLYILISDSYRDLIRKTCVGGIDKRQLNKDHIEDFPIIFPPKELQTDYVKRVESIERMKQQVQTAIKDLETLLASRMQYWFD